MIFRVLWVIDHWGHAHLSRRVHHFLLGGICDWCDRQLWKDMT